MWIQRHVLRESPEQLIAQLRSECPFREQWCVCVCVCLLKLTVTDEERDIAMAI